MKTKKTKVCHMTSAHGAEDVRIFHKECSSLAQAGYEVYLIECGESYEKNGVHIIGVGDIPSSRLKRMTEGAKRIYKRAVSLDCDIYHFHDPELLPYGLKLKKRGKRVVFDSHENTTDVILDREYLPRPVRTIVSFLYGIFEHHIVQKLDAVITVTPTQTNYFKEYCTNVVEVRNYPILNNNYTPPKYKTKSLVFAGGIIPIWNHENIIKALAKLPGWKYVLCGKDTALINKLKGLPEWENVDYKGQVPHHEAMKIISNCQIGMALTTPSRNSSWETGTMGNTKIFEEMMCGLPVICTDFILWREFIKKYDCGICVDPENIESIIEAVKYFEKRPDRIKEMGANGRRAIESEFNWKEASKALLQLYNELSHEPSQSH